MADEITVQASLKATKDGVSVEPFTKQIDITMESTLGVMTDDVQVVGTSSEALVTGDVDVSKQHWIMLRNIDPDNFVTVSVRKDVTPTDVDVGIMLKGSESFGPVRAPAQSSGYPHYRLKANTAACRVERVVVEAGDPTA